MLLMAAQYVPMTLFLWTDQSWVFFYCGCHVVKCVVVDRHQVVLTTRDVSRMLTSLSLLTFHAICLIKHLLVWSDFIWLRLLTVITMHGETTVNKVNDSDHINFYSLFWGKNSCTTVCKGNEEFVWYSSPSLVNQLLLTLTRKATLVVELNLFWWIVW